MQRRAGGPRRTGERGRRGGAQMRAAPVSIRRAAQEELPRAVRRRRRAAEILRQAASAGNVVDAGV